MTTRKFVKKSIKNIYSEILFKAIGKKLQMFESKALLKKPKNCTPSPLINNYQNELIFGVRSTI